MRTDELSNALQRGAAPAILDVRSRAEYRRARIPTAIHAPFWNARRLPAAVPAGNAPVVLYCGHGPRAWWAFLVLRSCGRRARLLRGHLAEWRRRGLPEDR